MLDKIKYMLQMEFFGSVWFDLDMEWSKSENMMGSAKAYI